MHCTFDLALFAGTFQLFIPRVVEFLMTGRHSIHRRDVSDGGMKADVVVMVDELADDALGILQSERGFRPDGLFLEGPVKTLEFPVGLGVVGGAEHVGGLPVPNECLEVFGHEL